MEVEQNRSFMKARNKIAVSKPGKRAKRGAPGDVYDLRLYVAGQTPKSIAAFANLKRLCDAHLAGKYRIEVIDLMKKPQLAKDDQVIAIPTLVRRLPQPIRKIIGDLCDTERALAGLDLSPRGEH
jgi:circadian clock protein KaiB